MNWQPVETIPPNTKVLLWHNGFVLIGLFDSDKNCWWSLLYNMNFKMEKPTHWAALPEPPEEEPL
jgi:hypothetical protein